MVPISVDALCHEPSKHKSDEYLFQKKFESTQIGHVYCPLQKKLFTSIAATTHNSSQQKSEREKNRNEDARLTNSSRGLIYLLLVVVVDAVE
jgi:hypothetical protein